MNRWMALSALVIVGACETIPSAHSATPAPVVIAQPAPSASPVMTPEQTLLEADRLLAGLAQQKGIAAALSETADPVDGFVIDKSGAYQGQQAIVQGLSPATAAGPMFWQADKVFVSRSADFGITSGNYVQVLTAAEAGQGRYIAVWRKDSGGTWRILSDVMTPKTKPAPKARVLR